MMEEAAVIACAKDLGKLAAVGPALANTYAALLSRLTAVYAVSEDRNEIRALAGADLRGGEFRNGGRELAFTDGRAPIAGLAVRRSELDPAIEALKRARAPRPVKP